MPKFVVPTAGELRTRIAIQQVSRVSDGVSGYTDTWTTILTTHARFDAWKGFKALEAAQIIATQIWEMTTRYPPTLTILPKMRIIDLQTSERYQITSVADPDKHRKWLYCLLTGIKPEVP